MEVCLIICSMVMLNINLDKGKGSYRICFFGIVVWGGWVDSMIIS